MTSKTKKRFKKLSIKKLSIKKVPIKKLSIKKVPIKKLFKKRKGGTKEECCICRKNINGASFIPSACLMKYGKIRAHKICNDCWWNSFAQETANHQCPGCAKGLPLNGPAPPKIIDLTEDD
jgi:hypothetical protein